MGIPGKYEATKALEIICQNCGGRITTLASPGGSIVCETCGIENRIPEITEIPFTGFRIRNLLALVIFSTFAVAFIDAELNAPGLDSLLECLWHFAFHGVVLLWALWNFSRSNVSVRRVIGALPDGYWWISAAVYVVPLILFSMGSGQIIRYLSWLLSPSFANEWFADEELSLARVLLTLIVVPPVEELFFRGILINKWTPRLGVKRAALTSSLIFAILHQNFMGAFVYGFVLSVLYVKTRTLVVPIICHILINGMAFGIGLVWDSFSSLRIVYVFNRLFYPVPWFGLLCLSLSVPWVIHFMRRNWPGRHWSAPYFA